jgi:segregation and condensation protein B
MEAHRIVEAILFASDVPLPPAKIATILGVGNARDVRNHVDALNAQYVDWALSFRIEEIAGGYQMMTLPAYNTWLAKLLRTRQETRLSPAALETLAIVAYKQPCTRADIEAIRGVAAGDLLNRLREMNLVRIVGRAEDLGRPLLYGTTKRFLQFFGLPSLEDLPQVEALGAPGPAPGQLEPTPFGSASQRPSGPGDAAPECLEATPETEPGDSDQSPGAHVGAPEPAEIADQDQPADSGEVADEDEGPDEDEVTGQDDAAAHGASDAPYLTIAPTTEDTAEDADERLDDDPPGDQAPGQSPDDLAD